MPYQISERRNRQIMHRTCHETSYGEAKNSAERPLHQEQAANDDECVGEHTDSLPVGIDRHELIEKSRKENRDDDAAELRTDGTDKNSRHEKAMAPCMRRI
jgi:hypothetical protein